MDIISTMNGYIFVGMALLDVAAIVKSAAMAVIVKSKILLSL